MSSQNPVYSPLSLGETNISQQKHPSKKSTALALVGTLVIFSTVSLAIFGGFSNDDSDDNFGIAHVPYHKTLTTQNESIQLGNRFKNRYFEFKYEIVRGNYSHTNEDELAVKPFIVRNIERHSDGEPYDVYLHKIKPDEEGMIYWKFNLKATDKVVKTLVIRMIGINQTLNEGGKAEACLETFENCTEIPVDEDLIIDMPRADTLFLGVKLYKNIKIFRKAERCVRCSGLLSGFSVKAYWVSTQDHLLNISSTFHDDSGRVFALSPKTGENYAKFTYNFINNLYSHTEPDGSPVRLFDFNGLERVEDYTENTVFLRRKNPKEKGNIRWALNLRIDGKYVEKVVIGIIGIEEIANRGGTARACWNVLYNCIDIPIDGTFTLQNNVVDLSLDIELDEDIQIFRTKLDDEGSLENVSVEVYWRGQRENN
ncbi:PAW domain-containing protein [Caenorhabditis elegans]|uniref:PAW domain-containing protein n=1 Tax=Caenorhabditis elegans TaxID=6239 RepID=A0A0K3AVD4_CAEEL|nr:PAW domain-containing protein [Caenorhabditis elegans]CTQ86970.1 PAW domain-containing protein [Caenorhabditis elegans]|eukprot:NP_001300271.1 Uncharacterized protein CELE_Y50D4B.4 [Caenorhabditis elegans]